MMDAEQVSPPVLKSEKGKGGSQQVWKEWFQGMVWGHGVGVSWCKARRTGTAGEGGEE